MSLFGALIGENGLIEALYGTFEGWDWDERVHRRALWDLLRVELC